jgi:hypothetical protein
MQFECRNKGDVKEQHNYFLFKYRDLSISTDYPLGQCCVGDWEDLSDGIEGSQVGSDTLSITLANNVVTFHLMCSSLSGCLGEMIFSMPFDECRSALADAAVAAAYVSENE